jgi:hypothetical protein
MFDFRRPEPGTETIRKPYRLHRMDHSHFRLYSEKVSEGATHFVSSFTNWQQDWNQGVTSEQRLGGDGNGSARP